MFYEHLKNERMLSGKETPPADKGKYSGMCQRTLCDNRPADWYNHPTRHYYCGACARQINEANAAYAQRLYGHELCTKGEHKPAE